MRKDDNECWAKHCQIAGINPELLGPADPPGTYIQQRFDNPPIPVGIPDYTDPTTNQLEDMMIYRIKSPYWTSKINNGGP